MRGITAWFTMAQAVKLGAGNPLRAVDDALAAAPWRRRFRTLQPGATLNPEADG